LAKWVVLASVDADQSSVVEFYLKTTWKTSENPDCQCGNSDSMNASQRVDGAHEIVPVAGL
jgi:hypothetical protein